MPSLFRPLILSLLILILASVAYAKGEEQEREELWQPTTPGPFVTFSAPVQQKNQINIQPLYFFNIGRGRFTAEGNYKSLPRRDYSDQQLIQLYAQYGLTDCWELDVQPAWQFNYSKVAQSSAESYGFADMFVMTRYCFIEETRWIPRATALFQVKLPTGKFQKSEEGKLNTDITGTGSIDYVYGFNFTKGIKPLLFHLDLLFTNAPSPVKIDGVKTEFSDTYTANGAVEWVFYKNFNLLGELLWQRQRDKRRNGDWAPSTAQSSLIFSTGIGYSKKSWQVLVGYQRTLAGQNVNANDTVAVTVLMNF